MLLEPLVEHFSGVWRIWSARNQPDLFVGVQVVGQLKATVHCPRPHRPTWKRHYGFDANARGEVVVSAIADGGRHKVVWTGCELAPECTLEWRVFIRGASLRKTAREVDASVSLLRPPEPNECLIVATIIGPTAETAGFPRAKEAETLLLGQERLSDGRRVWTTYTYVPTDTFQWPRFPASAPRVHGSEKELRDGLNELRATVVAVSDDGSLGLFDMRVDVVPKA